MNIVIGLNWIVIGVFLLMILFLRIKKKKYESGYEAGYDKAQKIYRGFARAGCDFDETKSLDNPVIYTLFKGGLINKELTLFQFCCPSGMFKYFQISDKKLASRLISLHQTHDWQKEFSLQFVYFGNPPELCSYVPLMPAKCNPVVTETFVADILKLRKKFEEAT